MDTFLTSNHLDPLRHKKSRRATMCFSCSFALLGFGLSRAGGREKKILNPRCPSWTHPRPAAPRIPGVQVGHIPGRRLSRIPGVQVGHIPSRRLSRIPGVQVGHIPSWQHPGSLVSKLDNDAAGEYRPSNCQLAGYGCIIKQPFEAGEC